MDDVRDVASRIDHTVLQAEATPERVDQACAEAKTHGFASVCVNPVYVQRVRQQLDGSGVRTCTVAGFPLGANQPAIKAREAERAAEDGAEELDIVAHLPNLLAADAEAAKRELAEPIEAARAVTPRLTVKVIVEAVLLMDAVEERVITRIEAACRAVREAGADYVKTSTGFHPSGGATIGAVKLLTQHAGMMKVKAAGGIRTWDDAVAMMEAGADRLGCSAGVAIVAGGRSEASY